MSGIIASIDVQLDWLTLTKCTDWAARIRCTASIASGNSSPPGTSSEALIRMPTGTSGPVSPRTASSTSSGSRRRFSSEPPYSSSRWFVSGEMNSASR